MSALRGPQRELRLLRDVLISAKGSQFNKDKVILLDDPTLADAQGYLFEFLNRADTDDTLLIYISGHAGLDRDELVLLFADAGDWSGTSGGLFTGIVSAALERTQASRVVLILDTSYAGSFRLPDSPRLKDDPTSYYFIGSAGPTEDARDLSPFAGALANALQASMASGDGLNPQFVFDAVFNQLAPEGIRPFYASRGAGAGLPPKASSGSGQKSIFISYAHEDARWLRKLQPHLDSLVRDVAQISYWDDSRIQPGEDWRQEIRDQLSVARAALPMPLSLS